MSSLKAKSLVLMFFQVIVSSSISLLYATLGSVAWASPRIQERAWSVSYPDCESHLSNSRFGLRNTFAKRKRQQAVACGFSQMNPLTLFRRWLKVRVKSPRDWLRQHVTQFGPEIGPRPPLSYIGIPTNVGLVPSTLYCCLMHGRHPMIRKVPQAKVPTEYQVS